MLSLVTRLIIIKRLMVLIGPNGAHRRRSLGFQDRLLWPFAVGWPPVITAVLISARTATPTAARPFGLRFRHRVRRKLLAFLGSRRGLRGRGPFRSAFCVSRSPPAASATSRPLLRFLFNLLQPGRGRWTLHKLLRGSQVKNSGPEARRGCRPG
jgi:hypothetical protein